MISLTPSELQSLDGVIYNHMTRVYSLILPHTFSFYYSNQNQLVHTKYQLIFVIQKSLLFIYSDLKRSMMVVDTKDQILNRDFSKEFISKMQNAMVMSHYKYEWCSQTYPELA